MPPPPPPPEAPPAAPVAVAAPMAPAAAPAAGPKFTWGGLVDAYYMFNFTRSDGSNTLEQPVFRQFDTNSNSATLSLAALSLNAAMDPVSFQLDMGYGASGSIINAANGVVLPPGPVPGSFVLLQAYGTITAMTNGPMALTFDFGKFYTTAGAEVIPANKNWLYSRSLLFFSIPLLHTGARANLKVNDQLSLQASLVNGWNNDPDNNAWKTIGLSASITASPMVSIVATTYFGKEATQGAAASTPGDTRFLADLVVALTLNDKLGVNFNFDYIKAPAQTAPLPSDVSGDYNVGAALMARYVINDHVNVAARGEFLRGHVDAAMTNFDLLEGTVMLGLPVGKNFELRPEFRVDANTGDPMLFVAGTKKSQFTGTLAALTYF